MIVKQFRQSHILYQSAADDDMPNEAVGVCLDNGDTICLNQRDQCIVLNRETVPELCKLLKLLAAKPAGGA